jgi:hypothetical protein
MKIKVGDCFKVKGEINFCKGLFSKNIAFAIEDILGNGWIGLKAPGYGMIDKDKKYGVELYGNGVIYIDEKSLDTKLIKITRTKASLLNNNAIIKKQKEKIDELEKSLADTEKKLSNWRFILKHRSYHD